jgi:putative ABC transport system permease protein
MKYLPLIWSGLMRKKGRTFLTLFSIVTAFFLFGILQGVNLGIDSLTQQFLDTARLRVTNRVNKVRMLPLAHRARIAQLPGVVAVTPLVTLVGTYQQPRNVVAAVGVDVESWFRIYPEFKSPDAQVQAMARVRNGALVGAAAAEKYLLKVGDPLPLSLFNVPRTGGSNSWEFTVVGIYDIVDGHSFSSNVLVNYDYVNEARSTGRNAVNQIIVRLPNANSFARVAPAIDELFANSADQTITQNEKDYAQSTVNQFGDIGLFVNGIVGAALFTLLFLTANTMMQSVRERTAEIAVMKTLGFSDTLLLTLVLVESLVMSAVAAVAGLLAASFVFPRMMQGLNPTVGLSGLRVPAVVFAWGALIAIILAFLSGFPPAWRARQLKVVDALARR